MVKAVSAHPNKLTDLTTDASGLALLPSARPTAPPSAFGRYSGFHQDASKMGGTRSGASHPIANEQPPQPANQPTSLALACVTKTEAVMAMQSSGPADVS
jgi:hypothetical protein